jgi:hypothetical protein
MGFYDGEWLKNEWWNGMYCGWKPHTIILSVAYQLISYPLLVKVWTNKNQAFLVWRSLSTALHSKGEASKKEERREKMAFLKNKKNKLNDNPLSNEKNEYE